MTIGATLFACGSTIFTYLFLRGRIVPVWLSWIGLVGSLLLVVALPLQMAGVLYGAPTNFIWIPIAFFEVVAGVWLLVKGAGTREGSIPASSGSHP